MAKTKAKRLVDRKQLSSELPLIPTLEDALGLVKAGDRTKPIPPRDLKTALVTPAAVACLKSLDALAHELRETQISFERYDGPHAGTLGTLTWLPFPDHDKPRANQGENCPLLSTWKKWFAERGDELRDNDGMELVRAAYFATLCYADNQHYWNEWTKEFPARRKIINRFTEGQAPFRFDYYPVVHHAVHWLLFLDPPAAGDFFLDAIETQFALVPAQDMARLSQLASEPKGPIREERDWRKMQLFELGWRQLGHFLETCRVKLSGEQQVRYWRLMHWRDRPVPDAPSCRVRDDLLLAAYAEGAANLADLTDQLLTTRGPESTDSWLLYELTKRHPEPKDRTWLQAHPEAKELVDRVVERIVEVELKRGDEPTVATIPANKISSLTGVKTLVRLLEALGHDGFDLGPRYLSASDQTGRQTLTRLVTVTYAEKNETAEDFRSSMVAAINADKFPEQRLLQLAFVAPQWAKNIEAYLGWEHLSEGVYWFLAHMWTDWQRTEGAGSVADSDEATANDEERGSADAQADDADSDDELADSKGERSGWERLIAERSPLLAEDRQAGAVDVAWFRRVYEQLGDKRWQELAAAARFATNPMQAKQARFIADVLLNRVKRQQLIDGIKKRFLKDHVRLLGLLPLATGKKNKQDLLERCKVLAGYRQYLNTKHFLSRPEGMRALDIGLKNLAQTAGYPDAMRLEWAVGREAVKDLAKGPVTLSKDGVKISLALDDLAKPVTTVHKGDKQLRGIPSKLKTDKLVGALVERIAELKRSASGTRKSLEAAMCRGDTFSGDELREWSVHPLVAPLLSRLVVIGEGVAGYPEKQGKSLRDFQGKVQSIKSGATLRIAHSYDFLQADNWHEWQRECFAAERIQPFKQVFRELYIVTKAERQAGTISRRFAGQNVKPGQASVLFRQRGWDTDGDVIKVFHDAGLRAIVDFDNCEYLFQVEVATIAGVRFEVRDGDLALPLVDVPPLLFSEVMRDLDLVVSVAQAGPTPQVGSAELQDMRASIVRETCALLKLPNVRIQPPHALITGQLANYKVHLGSGVIHKLPGGYVCIVPVIGQQRSRLYLPFAEDDPVTAEVLSKVLLLARDQDIQEASILEQITR